MERTGGQYSGQKEPSIRKNYIYNTFYQILTVITPLITAPYTARIFGADGIGVQSYTGSILSYFLLAAGLGTASYGQREIAMHRDDRQESSRIFWEIEILSVITTLASIILWIAFIIVTDIYKPYYIVQTMSLIAVAFDISWFFAGFEQFKFIVLRNTAVKLIGVLVLFAFVRDKDDLLLYIGLLAATGLIGNISMWTYLPQFLVKVNLSDSIHLSVHFKQTFTYFVPTIATSIYTVLDKTMVGLITGSTVQNGYYEQTTKVVKLLLALITSLNIVMKSRMSYLFSQNEITEIKERLRQSVRFVADFALPMTFGICGVAEVFVPWFFGEGYAEVVPLLYIYSMLIFPIGISNCIGGQYLNPSGQVSQCSRGVIAGAAVNFVLNTFMIRLWSSRGAAAASVIAEAVVAVVYMSASRGFISWRGIVDASWRSFLASVLMFAAIIVMRWTGIGGILLLALQVTAGTVIYGGLMILLRDPLALQCLDWVMGRLRGRH